MALRLNRDHARTAQAFSLPSKGGDRGLCDCRQTTEDVERDVVGYQAGSEAVVAGENSEHNTKNTKNKTREQPLDKLSTTTRLLDTRSKASWPSESLAAPPT